MTPEEKRRKHSDYMREYYRRNRDKGRAMARRYARGHSKEAVERVRLWRIKNKERWLARLRDHYSENRESELEKGRVFRAKHRDRLNAAARKRRTPARTTYEREWRKRKLETDLNYRIKLRLKNRIKKVLWSVKTRKPKVTMELIGCTVQFLRGYLEARFARGMTWKNYGKWHIDHIIPCAEFDLRDPVQQNRCFHYSNLQPLWAFDNISKKDKCPDVHQPELL
jgi:hypothetical protein